MNIETHTLNNTRIAEVLTDDLVLRTPQDGLDLLGSLYYQGFDGIILHKKNITPDFFDLKNGIAGEVLQKFSNYRVPLVVIGDFSQYTSKSMKDFIYESNNGRQVSFLPTLESALQRLNEISN